MFVCVCGGGGGCGIDSLVQAEKHDLPQFEKKSFCNHFFYPGAVTASHTDEL